MFQSRLFKLYPFYIPFSLSQFLLTFLQDLLRQLNLLCTYGLLALVQLSASLDFLFPLFQGLQSLSELKTQLLLTVLDGLLRVQLLLDQAFLLHKELGKLGLELVYLVLVLGVVLLLAVSFSLREELQHLQSLVCLLDLSLYDTFRFPIKSNNMHV